MRPVDGQGTCKLCGNTLPIEQFRTNGLYNGEQVYISKCRGCEIGDGDPADVLDWSRQIANARRILAQFGLTKEHVLCIRARVEFSELTKMPEPFWE
jgi:hypothetical protein